MLFCMLLSFHSIIFNQVHALFLRVPLTISFSQRLPPTRKLRRSQRSPQDRKTTTTTMVRFGLAPL